MGKEIESSGSNSVGSSKFVRTNPMSDRFKVKRFHHVEFWCSDATNVARRFSWALGMQLAAKSDLSTGNMAHASYLIRSGECNFLFTAPYSPSIAQAENLSPAATASIPTFDHAICRAFVASHGLAARAISVEVEDAETAFSISVSHGAKPSSPPTVLDNQAVLAEVFLFGDVVLRFEKIEDTLSYPLDYGICRLDHLVGSVPELGPAVSYLKEVTGFHEFAEFTTEDVGTLESGLNSLVLGSNNEMVLLVICEPVFGTKRRSQIQTFLEHNDGEEVQHLALVSEDIFKTLREMKKRSGVGGFEFMPPPPPTYYKNLKKRAGDVLSNVQIKECEELGVLVDRDDQGTLLQIFTKPFGDRPTTFIEIIQRIGCMIEDDTGKMYQKGRCGGFGKGNFSELFKSVEEYEKSLEPKKTTECVAA
ncbi:4-hydroxyphenylpyruvate dioxygenase-like isoform X2 [Herrania umbratica]|uniref:4-hydroxyphenylpyruvate dioxygenase n=1 Tax=Herrania umbratica TaxID=108875 RepID=A0A6J0ZIH7_9ROSI|nr:4-hydroxyphenylpyruvate dioxygenase-like isoform X2 [Herrania umbratica]